MKSSYQFRIDQKLHKQVDLEHDHETLIVRIAYRVGNSVTRDDETRIAIVGVPRSEPGAHGVRVVYRERPFRIVPWLTFARSRFF
jgi:hypothetical protein